MSMANIMELNTVTWLDPKKLSTNFRTLRKQARIWQSGEWAGGQHRSHFKCTTFLRNTTSLLVLSTIEHLSGCETPIYFYMLYKTSRKFMHRVTVYYSMWKKQLPAFQSKMNEGSRLLSSIFWIVNIESNGVSICQSPYKGPFNGRVGVLYFQKTHIKSHSNCSL